MYKFNYLTEKSPHKTLLELLRIGNTDELIQFNNGFVCQVKLYGLSDNAKQELIGWINAADNDKHKLTLSYPATRTEMTGTIKNPKQTSRLQRLFGAGNIKVSDRSHEILLFDENDNSHEFGIRIFGVKCNPESAKDIIDNQLIQHLRPTYLPQAHAVPLTKS